MKNPDHKKVMGKAYRKWICWVVKSGYHNGASCQSSEPHEGWGCGWHYHFEYLEKL